MATTPQGREATEAHRVAQVTVGQSAQLEAEANWYLLDAAALDASTPRWLAATALGVASRYRHSQTLAVAYLAQYREAELGTTSGPVITPALAPAVTAALLRGAGPIAVKKAIKEGLSVDDAMARGLSQLKGTAGRLSMNGGRSTIDKSSRADRRARRYRRVSDGNPCAFCAMLVTRGYTYSEQTAFFRAHPHCGCTAEPGYGIWEPDDLEAEWLDAYLEAAKEAKAAEGRIAEDTVLWRMRRVRPDLFSDGVQPAA